MQNSPSASYYAEHIAAADRRILARAISIVENQLPQSRDLLLQLRFERNVPIWGITGPPGAGKSTLVNALVSRLLAADKKIAIVAIDPTSPFNFGALLGDRIRLAQHFNHPNVYIRSLASRHSLGGLADNIVEICEVLRAADFDHILIETVGVGQSEVEIAGLADTTVVVLVPEAGDEVQTMKAGLMEIADIFVVNKADRADAEQFYQNLVKLTHARPFPTPVLKCVASQQGGIENLYETLCKIPQNSAHREQKAHLLTQKTMRLLQKHFTRHLNEQHIFQKIKKILDTQGAAAFHLYRFIDAEIAATPAQDFMRQ